MKIQLKTLLNRPRPARWPQLLLKMKKETGYFLNNMIDFTWMIGGEAGFGIMTTGVVFSKIATRSGYNIFDYVEYPSLIRGGHNAYEVHVSEAEVSHLKSQIEVLVCLN